MHIFIAKVMLRRAACQAWIAFKTSYALFFGASLCQTDYSANGFTRRLFSRKTTLRQHQGALPEFCVVKVM